MSDIIIHSREIWIVDGIVMPQHAMIVLAFDFGYNGNEGNEAAEVLKANGYRVECDPADN